jgi:hypothetical protein
MTLERILKMRFGSGDLRRRRWLVDHFALDGQFPAPSDIVALEEILMQLHRFFVNQSQSMPDWTRQDDSGAKSLSGLERAALFVDQRTAGGIPPRPYETILHIAKTEEQDLKYLGAVASASATKACGLGMTADDKQIAQQIRRAIDFGLTPSSHSFVPEQHSLRYLDALIAAAHVEKKKVEESALIAEARKRFGDGFEELLDHAGRGPTKTDTINRMLAMHDQLQAKKKAS